MGPYFVFLIWSWIQVEEKECCYLGPLRPQQSFTHFSVGDNHLLIDLQEFFMEDIHSLSFSHLLLLLTIALFDFSFLNFI